MEAAGLRDIIGPIMVGPSSSHTAGALRIAAMARTLCAGAPRTVVFKLYGSFAHTYTGHGTDKALVAGMLGLATDDLRIRDSFDLARAARLEFIFEPLPGVSCDHPNTVEMEITDDAGALLDVRGISVGGGAAVIDRINGVDVSITGEHNSIVIKQTDEKGVLAHIAGCIRDFDVNIATARMYRERRGAVAYTVMETDEAIGEALKVAIQRSPAITEVRIIAAEGSQVSAMGGCDDAAGAKEAGTIEGSAGTRAAKAIFPTEDAGEEAFAALDFESGAQLLELCQKYDCTISTLFYQREGARLASRGEAADTNDYLRRVLAVMRAATREPVAHPQRSMGGLIGGEAQRLADAAAQGHTVCGGQLARATIYALAVLETNASMGRIVAAPTAGSSGVIPAVLFSLQEEYGFDDEALGAALLNAAATGYLIARNATVSGAEGGCQAEIGAAAAMAASAATELAGGTPAQCLAAASNAIANMLGLVCDPIAGLVEAPCQQRNASGAATALVSAQVALAGVANLVDFDQTVAALYAVGRALPFELRETALGGMAATPAACDFCKSCRL
ncbi:MAG: L-serine ammonia-lyase, iron-sulfur-dependent, subunit alpha [Raoultibacter sp.]